MSGLYGMTYASLKVLVCVLVCLSAAVVRVLPLADITLTVTPLFDKSVPASFVGCHQDPARILA